MTTRQDNEIDITKLGMIVSKTDLNGTIIEANEAFVIASGYAEKELLGQPHNILRHPDVPKAVFADMWATLKSGLPWVQIVKNRCKDGSYYWVEANVTPILENGSIVGYQSVRSPVDSETKALAQQLYKDINAGTKKIKNGYVINTLDQLCLFNHIHPVNLMILMILVLGSLSTVSLLGLIPISAEIIALLTLFFTAYTWAGKKYIFNRLGASKKVMDNMRQGNFSGQVNYLGKHSLSKLVASVKMMQIQLGASYEDAQVKLQNSLRLKSALDAASSSIMMVNKTGEVLYINHQLCQFFEKNQLQIQTVSPSFDYGNMIGKKLNTICTHEFFNDLNQSKQSEENLAGLIVNLNVLPVTDSNGKTIGSIVGWVDVTQQRTVEKELKATLEMASIGHTDININTENLTGFYLETSNNINTLLSELNAIIENMVNVMTKLAVGDIRGRVTKDLQGSLAAMKGATNVSLDNLSSIILHIKNAAQTVGQASIESSNAALDLSDRTQQAAAALEQINASMQNMADLQKQNAFEISDVNASAKKTVEVNKNAKISLDATVNSIQQIQNTSEKISNIITIIDGIAFQTNLLALNAAVEAARAGEHGRGFAVVAGEVRSLAQKSAEAASDIKKLIESSATQVNEGVAMVNKTHHAFAEVDEQVENIGIAMQTVLSSINDQQTTVSEIAQALNTLDSNIQSNAALVEESSAASVSLKEQAEFLNSETNKFSLDETKALDLIQGSNASYGVNISEVRQKMRIWRTTAQTYLNGIDIEFDAENASDPSACSVGCALSTLVSENPSISQMPEYIHVTELHEKQHDLVKQALLLIDQQNESNKDKLKDKDQIMDEFVVVTDLLDTALSKLSHSISPHY